MNFRKKITSVAIGLVTIVGSVSLGALPASAETGSGAGSSCDGPCTQGGPFHWRYAITDDQGTAYDKLRVKQYSGLSIGLFDKVLKGVNKGPTFYPQNGMSRTKFISLCQRSDVIWWVSADALAKNPFPKAVEPENHMWVWNFSGGDRANYPRILNNPNGSAGEAEDINHALNIGNSKYTNDSPEMKESLRNLAHSDIKSGSGPTLICSATFEGVQPDPIINTWVERQEIAPPSARTWIAPYTWKTEIDPQFIEGYTDKIGENNLHSQVNTKRSISSREVRNLPWSSTDLYGDYVRPIENMIRRDEQETHAVLDLDERNKQGMAEGGVLNVREGTRNIEISVSPGYEYGIETCRFQQRFDWVKPDGSTEWEMRRGKVEELGCNTKWYGDDDDELEGPIVYNLSWNYVDFGRYQDTAFWQMLSVHCNEDGFNSVVSSAPGAEVKSGNPDPSIASVAHSRKYDSQPPRLDFGERGESASLDFYTKECGFECVAGGDATNPGRNAGANGDRFNNVRSENVTEGEGNRYGAFSPEGNVNSNNLTFFRDNEKHEFKTDVWFPKNTSIVNYDGSNPLSTTITRNSDGTPAAKTDNPSAPGQVRFWSKTAEGDSIELFNGRSAPAKQKNFSKDLFSSQYAQSLDGLHDTIEVSSAWASEDGKPHKIAFNWEYAPSVTTSVATQGLGFRQQNSDRMIGSSTNTSASVQGRCMATYGNRNTTPMDDILRDNTGWHTPNNMDVPVSDEAGDESIKTTFIRSSGE